MRQWAVNTYRVQMRSYTVFADTREEAEDLAIDLSEGKPKRRKDKFLGATFFQSDQGYNLQEIDEHGHPLDWTVDKP
jgi:hypothetical protein